MPRARRTRSMAASPASGAFALRSRLSARPSDVQCAAAGAARDAAGLKFAQARLLRAIVDRDPDDQQQYHHGDQPLGRRDERRVGTKGHRYAAPISFDAFSLREPVPTSLENAMRLACIICRLRTRRRRISLRIAARCNVTNSSEKATAITSSGIRNE